MLDALLAKLARGRPKTSGLDLFTQLLFQDADPQLVSRLGEASLGEIAIAAAEFIAEKPVGRHKVRYRQVGVPARASTVIELLNDDMPFLVDSVTAEVLARDCTVQQVLHPIFKTRRGAGGRLEAVTAPGDKQWQKDQESFIQIYLEPIDDAIAADLTEELGGILEQVRSAVADWQPMLQRVRGLIQTYHRSAMPVSDAERAESIAFLEWLEAGHFTFLGMREFSLAGDVESGTLDVLPEQGLGVLRNPEVRVLRRGNEMVHLTPEIRRFYQQPTVLIVSKANTLAKVHRRTHLDYIGAKLFGEDGRVTGELRIVGLFTSAAYTRSVRAIPFLRNKADRVIAASGFPPDSHNGKVLLNIIETYPRDELFQISVEQLREWALEILDLDLRPRIRVFPRIDEFDRFVTALVYVPRDRFSTEVRQRIAQLLCDAYQGRLAAFTPHFLEGPLVRTHFVIARTEGPTPRPDPATLEEAIRGIVQSWQDRLATAIHAGDDDRARALFNKYGNAFSAGYRETFGPERALQDIARVEVLTDQEPVAIDFYDDETADTGRVRVAIYRLGPPIPLSDRVPVLENFGFRVIDERSYRMRPSFDDGTRDVRLHDMVLETPGNRPIVLGDEDLRLEEAFLAVWRGDAESDGFNRLILAAGLDWRRAEIFRAYGAYLRQLRLPFTPADIAQALTTHASVTRLLMDLFGCRLDPSSGLAAEARADAAAAIRVRIEEALASIPSLDEDRILRHMLNLIQSTLRTNFFVRDAAGGRLPALAVKLRSAEVDGMPEPRPYAEIWIYAPRVEGVHLRFAPIARGGLRWSDRALDFRTEVLGLVKAQQVKNTVIVPQGAKGGFLPKRLPVKGDREAFMKEGVAAYEIFVSSLLDLTDNIVDDVIVPPRDVVRHDQDDPYLVVAADKGTATFSDFANSIAVRRGFWLGDAFASGGSAGYDHKKMAITARGAWECVKRHFRELGTDIQTMPFRVIGIGDMSGDVFGNGMLLSKEIRLVAAFDHRDIFIDPEPDAAASFGERQRLFQLPRSSWQDYDKALISNGGGVFSRSSKSIPVSAEMQRLLGSAETTLTPSALINAILKAPADLLWLGGIGTYVRATTETDEQVGDRANDSVRITASELRVKVIGEGANLGLTHRGRIEFAKAGGKVNADFIDNSAGVNSSDQEVNIKIAFGPLLRSGRLDLDARNAVLVAMTGEVAEACLENNYQQSLSLSLGESRGLADIGFQQRLIRDLEQEGLLDRGLEALPTDRQISERIKTVEALTRPELAVLLSYAKISLSRHLLASNLPDDPQLADLLHGYFPTTMQRDWVAAIDAHRLRREIIATVLTNNAINRGGSTFVVRLEEETGHLPATIVTAFAAVVKVFDLESLWSRIDKLDSAVPATLQLELYRACQNLVRRQSHWFLRRAQLGDGLGALVGLFKPGIDAMRPIMGEGLSADEAKVRAERTNRYVAEGVPEDLAREIALLDRLGSGTDIVAVARATGRPVPMLVRLYTEVGSHFRLDTLREAAESMPLTDYFDRLAVNSSLSILSDAQRAVLEDIARASKDDEPSFKRWLDRHGKAADRAKVSLDEIIDSGAPTLARLTVAAAQLRDLVHS
ncbi:MAG: NAD-glutamate dehydrogenase [Hyphomicrobiaceae bacterium]